MDLNDYWQENKRFVTTVALGLLLFLVGRWILARTFGDELNSTKGSISKLQRDLGREMFTAADRQKAEEQNEELRAAVERLNRAVQFVARPDFRLDPSQGSTPNQYLRAVSRVRDDLIPRANRANLKLDPGLGMPKLSPTRDAEIERYLEALDVIDAAVRMAIDARVERIDKIQIRLDPGLTTRAGLDRIERTRIQLTVVGTSLAVAQLLTETQRGHLGRPLQVASAELVPARNKDDEIRLDLTLVVARLHAPEEEEVTS